MNWLIKIVIGMGLLGMSASIVMANDVSKQCYFDAISAYQAMSQAQMTAKKQALKLNINTATASDFASLSGVGVSTAERIVHYRTQVGRFASVDDLLQVKGVGKATLDKNRHRLSVLD